MDNESQDERRKKQNKLHHPWKNNKIRNDIKNRSVKSFKNSKRGNR